VIHRYQTIDSTMHEAVRLAQAGCASGTAVLAEEQTAGHGRFGRPWHSARGEGLYVSVVLRLDAAPADLPVVTLALGLAVADAISSAVSVACDLRWPNDVLIGEKKVAGILTELHGGAVVAGVGINVNQTAFPEELASIATSLRIASGKAQPLDSLLDLLLSKIGEHTALLCSDGREPVLRLFSEASSYVRGRRVTVELPDGEIEGVTDGLDSSGFLLLRRDNGERITILAGGVRPAKRSCC
jgi:BirA family transcriptional regulator, biotin operon repressor / biotin---[acetyl-CoA-carboxylase] ligase